MTEILRRLGNFFDWVLNAAVFVAGFLVAWQTFSVTANTLLRYLFNSPITGVENITEYGILWLTFLAAAWLLKRDKHIRVDLVTNLLGDKTQAIINIINSLMAIVLCVIMLYYGIQVTAELFVTGESDPFKIQGFPKAIPVSIIPFGFLLLTVQFIRKFHSNITYIRKTDLFKKKPTENVTTKEKTI